MILTVVVLGALIIVAVSALVADVVLGSPPRATFTRPHLAFQRLARDAYRAAKRGNPWPGSDWPLQVGPPFVEPGQVRQRQERVALARRELDELAIALGAITYDQEWGSGAIAELAGSVRNTRRDVIRDAELTLDARADATSEFTIVLYGRTKAGKSSLFAALTNTGFDGIGDGRQNVTRELHHWTAAGVDLLDTPGINGVGSAPLETDTERAVRAADLVIAQVTDDALFLEDFARLEEVGRHARPLVAAVNVKKGDVNKVINEPEKVFRERRLQPLVKRLKTHLPSACADAPIVPYHAAAAVASRRGRWRQREILWSTSRIQDVIHQIEKSIPAALRYAHEASDLTLSDLLADLVDAEQAARSDIQRGVQQRHRQVNELEGILAEVGRSSTVVDREIDDHFLAAEEEIVDALDDPDADFERVLSNALQLAKLDDLMQERLQAAADELTEKYAEFKADLEIAGRMAEGSEAFKALRDEALADQQAKKSHAKAVTMRRLGRIGVKVVAAVAVVVQPELAPFVAGVAMAADQLLRNPQAPASSDPAQRHEQLRAILVQAAKQQKQVYASALTSQIIDPARRQLVTPVSTQLDAMKFIVRSIDKALDFERAALEEVAVRLGEAESQEVATVGP